MLRLVGLVAAMLPASVGDGAEGCVRVCWLGSLVA